MGVNKVIADSQFTINTKENNRIELEKLKRDFSGLRDLVMELLNKQNNNNQSKEENNYIFFL